MRNDTISVKNKETSAYFEVICIGAGPAGLTAAYQLIMGGTKPLVLEADKTYVGGISRTVNYKGYRFDIGGHRFFTKSKEISALWQELLPAGMEVRKRTSRIFYDKKFFSYPLQGVEALKNLGLAESIACCISYIIAKLFPCRKPKSFEDWVSNNFGKRLFKIFFKSYTEKVWGMSCSQISADWASQRIKGLSLGKVVLNSLTPRTFLSRTGSVKSLIESFLYPKFGPGMLWEEAARKISNLGGEVRLGCQVKRLSLDSITGIWTVVYQSPLDVEIQVTCKHVVSSAAIRDLLPMISPTPNSLKASQTLRYRDFIVVALIVKTKELFTDNWIYIHDPTVSVGRIQNYGSWSEDMIAEKGTSCLGLEYFCNAGDSKWNLPDSELVALATEEILKLGILKKSDILDSCIVRQEKAYPVYDETYESIVSGIRKEISKRFSNLHLVGRNGMHKYNNQDHSMMTAILVARNILANRLLFDPWLVNSDAEYLEVQTRKSPGSTGIRQVPISITASPSASVPLLSAISRRNKLKMILPYLNAGQKILEIGAGNSWFAQQLRDLGHTVVTIDLEDSSADIKGDIRNWKCMGLCSHSFDLIIALELIEHVDCLDALRHLIKPDGMIYLSSPHPKFDKILHWLEVIGLSQRRTSAHINLTDFAKIKLQSVFIRRQAGIHQVGLFRGPSEAL